MRWLGCSAKPKEHPWRKRKPNEEQDPHATSEEVVVLKDLRQRSVRKHQPHEELEGDREKQPNEPDQKCLAARRWGQVRMTNQVKAPMSTEPMRVDSW
jgi:hypothetical protein